MYRYAKRLISRHILWKRLLELINHESHCGRNCAFPKKKMSIPLSQKLFWSELPPPPHPLHPCRTSRLPLAPPLLLPLKLVLQWITTIIYKEISQGINLLSGLVNTGRI